MTLLVSKIETMEQEIKNLSEKVLFLEDKIQTINMIPNEKPNLLTIKDITDEYGISRTSFYFIRDKDNISPKGYKGKIKLFDRDEVENSVIRKVG